MFLIESPDLTEEAVQDKKAWLRHNISPTNIVHKYMMELQTSRLQWIQGEEQPSLDRILEDYPRLGDPNGHEWVR